MADINQLKTGPATNAPIQITDPNLAASTRKPININLADLNDTKTTAEDQKKSVAKVQNAIDTVTANTPSKTVGDTKVFNPADIPNFKDPDEPGMTTMEDEVKSQLHDAIERKQQEAREELEALRAASEVNKKIAEAQGITFDEDGNPIDKNGNQVTELSDEDNLEAALDIELAQMGVGHMNPPHEDDHEYEQVDDAEFDALMNEFDQEHPGDEIARAADHESNITPVEEIAPPIDLSQYRDYQEEELAAEEDGYITDDVDLAEIESPQDDAPESDDDDVDGLLKELEEANGDGEDEDLDEEEQQKEFEEFTQEASKIMNLAPRRLDISDFKVAGKISATSVLSSLTSGKAVDSSDWALSNSRLPITMSKFNGIDLKNLSNFSSGRRNRQNTAMERYKLLYDHDLNPYKPDTVEGWAKTISSEDEDDLFFAVYDATFHNANHIPYTCPNEKCSHAWISPHIPTSSMYRFVDPEFEKEFMAIRDKGPVKGQQRNITTKIVPITDSIAVGVKNPDIYDRRFVYGLVGAEFYQKYSDVLDIYPFIDQFYKIDLINKRLEEIVTAPKGKEGELLKNIKNRVIIYNRIIKSLDTDEYNLLIAVLGQRDEEQDKKRVEYFIPAATCPKCGRAVPEQILNESNGNTIETQLFTRRPLALIANTSTT
jgi:hypothetical protein